MSIVLAGDRPTSCSQGTGSEIQYCKANARRSDCVHDFDNMSAPTEIVKWECRGAKGDLFHPSRPRVRRESLPATRTMRIVMRMNY